jgi:hypothetical protein
MPVKAPWVRTPRTSGLERVRSDAIQAYEAERIPPCPRPGYDNATRPPARRTGVALVNTMTHAFVAYDAPEPNQCCIYGDAAFGVSAVLGAGSSA